MSEPDLKRILVLFTEWLAREDILPRITEQECSDLGKAFLAGFMLGSADTLATTAHGSSSRPSADRAAPRAGRCRVTRRQMLSSGTGGPRKTGLRVLTCPMRGKAEFSGYRDTSARPRATFAPLVVDGSVGLWPVKPPVLARGRMS